MNANAKVAERKCYINGQFSRRPPAIRQDQSGRRHRRRPGARGRSRHVDAAVRAAKAALKGPWGKLACRRESICLRKVADGIDKRFDDFLAAEVAIRASPSRSRATSISRAARRTSRLRRHRRTYARVPTGSTRPDGKGAVNYALRKPTGRGRP